MNTLDLPRRVGVVSKFLQRGKKKVLGIDSLQPVFEHVDNGKLKEVEEVKRKI